MPRHQGLWEQDWADCERCGFIYPISMLTMQKGKRICTKTCLDDLDVEYRPLAISRALEQDDREYIRDKDEQTDETGWDDLIF
jgi:hypothetical protein